MKEGVKERRCQETKVWKKEGVKEGRKVWRKKGVKEFMWVGMCEWRRVWTKEGMKEGRCTKECVKQGSFDGMKDG